MQCPADAQCEETRPFFSSNKARRKGKPTHLTRQSALPEIWLVVVTCELCVVSNVSREPRISFLKVKLYLLYVLGKDQDGVRVARWPENSERAQSRWWTLRMSSRLMDGRPSGERGASQRYQC